jgi:hypothetical protein
MSQINSDSLHQAGNQQSGITYAGVDTEIVAHHSSIVFIAALEFGTAKHQNDKPLAISHASSVEKKSPWGVNLIDLSVFWCTLLSHPF